MRIIIRNAICLLLLGASGCANPNTSPQNLKLGSATDTLVMGPNLRLVTERPRPLGDDLLPTVCTEPSPDVAVAFGRSLAVQASVAETAGTTTSGSLNAASTETATALAGRTAGVLALRDGLYAACQSYVNGMLGHDAYAVILSQYGRLLVALAGTGTGGTAPMYTAQESALSAMLISCISQHDPTRIRPVDARGRPDLNPLFTMGRCAKLLDHIAYAKPAPKKDTKKPEAKQPEEKTNAKAPGPGEKITTTEKTSKKTVTEASGPPAK